MQFQKELLLAGNTPDLSQMGLEFPGVGVLLKTMKFKEM